MEWSDLGLVMGTRHHGETSVILELMTKNHGRHLGLVRGGRSRRLRPVLQPGNILSTTWRARLDEHLGAFQVETLKARAANIMADRTSLFCVQIISSHLRLLPERDAHASLYDAANIILDHANEPQIAARLLVHFEIALLEDLGYGLNLTQCAVSGSQKELIWVSPKSGCAVSQSEGAPWSDKLLPLPTFLSPSTHEYEPQNPVSVDAILAGLSLTQFFLRRNIYEPRAISQPDERRKLINELNSDDANLFSN